MNTSVARELAIEFQGGRTVGATPRSLVLLADDDDVVRSALARALRRHGCDVVEAGDGVDALARASDHNPDIAIVDLQMPRIDGGAVVAELKRRHGAVLPVLVLSGMDDPDHRIGAFNMGADDFIPKPVSVVELLKRVDAFERTRRAFIAAQVANARADRLRLLAAEAAALLAHDLNNGLSIALANLHYLQDEVPLSDEPRAALEATLNALRRMSGLAKNFVDVSRLEDDAITPQRQDIDVGELLTQAVAIHDPSGRGGVIRVSAPQDLVVALDPTLIERVIHNLLSNATRYVNDGGEIRVSAMLERSPAGDQLALAVANTGASVPAALRGDLFEKYRTGPDGKAQNGMGLYFCRLACEAHGGSISLEHTARFPTCFVIRLPV